MCSATDSRRTYIDTYSSRCKKHLLRRLWVRIWFGSSKSRIGKYALIAFVLKHKVGWWKFAASRARIIYSFGIMHEPKVSSFVTGLRGRFFVDVGAGYGWYISLLRGNFARTVAIEADPHIASWLKGHVPVNCKVLNVAVTEKDGTVVLYRKRSDRIGSPSVSPNDLALGTITVPCASLSSLFPSDEIDLVKVDVEGAEWLVVKGAENIMQRIHAWIVELHDKTRRAELVSYMEQHGYRCKWLDEIHGYFTMHKSTVTIDG
jgi:FkbM family methyltransferase